jgi:hypothetical protein
MRSAGSVVVRQLVTSGRAFCRSSATPRARCWPLASKVNVKTYLLAGNVGWTATDGFQQRSTSVARCASSASAACLAASSRGVIEAAGAATGNAGCGATPTVRATAGAGGRSSGQRASRPCRAPK